MNRITFNSLIGNGSPSSPYELSTCEAFDLLRQYVNSGGDTSAQHFILTQDLDFQSFQLEDSTIKGNFIPIGCLTEAGDVFEFKGVLDGRGHCLSHLRIVDQPTSFNHTFNRYTCGIFRTLHGASIQNLRLSSNQISCESSRFTGYRNFLVDGFGLLSGITHESVVTNITASDNQLQTNMDELALGGLIGCALAESYITECDVRSTLTKNKNKSLSEHTFIGGICGVLSHSFLHNNDCEPTIIGGYNLGGLVGHVASSEVRSNAVCMDIEGVKNLGGLAGYCENARLTSNRVNGTIQGFRNLGGAVGYSMDSQLSQHSVCVTIRGTEGLGGLCGHSGGGHLPNGTVAVCCENKVENSSLSGTDDVGGLCGSACETNFTANVFTGEIKARTNVGGGLGVAERCHLSYEVVNASLEGDLRVGGACGAAVNIVAKRLTTLGRVQGSQNIGGLLGTVGGFLSLADCQTRMELDGDLHSGGLIGWCEASATCSLPNFKSLPGIHRVLALGANPAPDWGGGLIGGGKALDQLPIKAAYWDEEMTQQIITCGGGTSASTVSLTGKNAERTLRTFDFQDVWETAVGDYPRLRPWKH